MLPQKNDNLNSWDNFISGNFLKAVNVISENDPYLVIGLEEVLNRENDSTNIRLKLQRNEIELDFDLNKTNIAKLIELGIKNPKDIINKKIYFKKALVRNPQTNKEVEGLRIWRYD